MIGVPLQSIDTMKIESHWSQTQASGQTWDIYQGDALEVLKTLSEKSVDCIVTSPPYFWLRDYGIAGQIGHEEDVSGFVDAIAAVMDEAHRVLKKQGTLFLNLGDTYYSGKGKSHGTDPKSAKRRFGLRAVDKSGGLGIDLRPKSLIGIPWRVAMEMTRRRWVLRSAIIWHRRLALGEAVLDRPRRSYENIFMFAKDRSYYFNREAIANVDLEEDVWTINARPAATPGINTAPFPAELVKRCLDIACPPNGIVLDPFAGSGTSLITALQGGRSAIGIDLNPLFCKYMVRKMGEIL